MPSETREMPGYTSLWNSSKKRKGYSGTAIYVAEPIANKIREVHYGLGSKEFDGEGRLITIEFEDFVVCNGYFPNGGMGPERLSFKMGYYEAFMSFIEDVRKRQPNVLWMGDVNTAHCPIDLARPDANKDNTGFLPMEREWIDEMVSLGYVDTFRYFNPDKVGAYTYWDMKTRARERNVGWRIDYIFATEELMPKVCNAQIHSSIMGSDHCPISVDVEL
jgi:exodeoxyribonuclease-3